MELEKTIQLIIYIHAALGGIALLCGLIALIAVKGSNTHRRFGKVFFYTMLISAIASAIVANMPNHENYFLFSIGVFSSYFLISGYRSLNFKLEEPNLVVDKSMAIIIVFVGLAMILYPALFTGKLNIILTVFGFVGVTFGMRDLMLLKDHKKLKEKWIRLHLGKITGGYISAVTAFFVVNQILPGIWNWFVPSIIGSAYITYWMIKTNKVNL